MRWDDEGRAYREPAAPGVPPRPPPPAGPPGPPPPGPPPNGSPWQARFVREVLTERGLATLLTLLLVGSMLWGQYRLITDARAVGNAQVAQQERIIARLDEALEHLKRIEALTARAVEAQP